MSHSSTSSSSDSPMSMDMGVFHWSGSGDGIWLSSWVPQSEGAYIGACFGLLFISILSRSLPAMEAYFIAWTRIRHHRLYEKPEMEKTQPNSDQSSLVYDMYPSAPRLPSIPAFSWKTDVIRSFLTALNSFVVYLLMMVVMTGNGGFFLVIVLGIFFGELAFGRFKSLNTTSFVDDHSH